MLFELTSARRRADFEAAVRPHLDELYGTAVRLTRCRIRGHDLLQDALLRGWAFWHRFESGTNVRAWMHRILLNSFINDYRRSKREREVLAEVHRLAQWRVASARIEEERELDGLSDEVLDALERLPSGFRRVVELVDRDGHSYQEVADLLGCPIGTVMSRLHRGRKILKRSLQNYAAEEGYVRAA